MYYFSLYSTILYRTTLHDTTTTYIYTPVHSTPPHKQKKMKKTLGYSPNGLWLRILKSRLPVMVRAELFG